MIQDRQAYRKKISSSGLIYLAGEVLKFNCRDVSAKGALIELQPGKLITSIEDVQSAIQGNTFVDIFIRELQITGQAKIVWTKGINHIILLGLEFEDAIIHAQRLWRQRRSYRKNVSASGCLIVDQTRFEFKCRNISADGLIVSVNSKQIIQSGMVVEIESEPLDLKGVATVIWVKHEKDSRNAIGLRYLRSK